MDFSVLAAVAVVLGYGVLGLTGFGSALVAVPLLSWIWPLERVVPVVLALDVASLLAFGAWNRRAVRWRAAVPLLGGAVGGTVLASALRAHLPVQAGVLLVLLGAWVGAVAVRGLRDAGPGPGPGPVPRPVGPRRPAVLPGIVAGVVETWFGTAGPVIGAALAGRFGDAEAAALRATLGATVLAVAGLALAAQGVSGRIDAPLVATLAWAAPLALAATWAGHRAAARVDPRRVRRAVLVLLAASAAVLVARGAMQLGGGPA